MCLGWYRVLILGVSSPITVLMLRARYVAVGAAALVVGVAGWWWVAGARTVPSIDKESDPRSGAHVTLPSVDLGALDGDIAQRIRQAQVDVAANPNVATDLIILQ